MLIQATFDPAFPTVKSEELGFEIQNVGDEKMPDGVKDTLEQEEFRRLQKNREAVLGEMGISSSTLEIKTRDRKKTKTTFDSKK